MKIGILKTGDLDPALAAEFGQYPELYRRFLALADAELSVFSVDVNGGEALGAPQDADAWLISGSKHGVYDGLDWIDRLKRFVRDCVARRAPVVGICFGHQILAEALGGRAGLSPKGWGVGVHSYDVVAAPSWMAGAGTSWRLHAMHRDQVETPPSGATVLARSGFCAYAALAYGDPEAPSAISVQGHPEFDAGLEAALIGRRAESIGAERAAAAMRSVGSPVDNALWAQWVVAYLRRAHAARRAA